MPKRDWRNRLACGLTVGICFATLLYVYASFFHGEVNCRQYNQGGKADLSYQEDHRKECDVPQLWSFTQRLVSSEDTLAQWVMAFLSLVAVGVSAWAVLLVKDSLNATNSALGEARKANSIARMMGEAQTRAYVHIKFTQIYDFKVGDNPRFNITVTNAGQTPAYDFRVKWITEVSSNPNSVKFRFRKKFDASISDLGPGIDNILDGRIFPPEFRLAPEHVYRIKTGQDFIVIAGILRYRDIFNINRRVIFKVFSAPESGGNGTFSTIPASRNNKSS